MIFLTKKAFILSFASLFIFSCSDNSSRYEKEFYEQISGICIPGNATIVESIDNGEFFTAATFRIDSNDFIRFIHDYKFIKVEKGFGLGFFADSYLRKDKPDLRKLANLYYHAGIKGKNSWLYLADIERKLLWAEIQYPDAAAH